MTSKRQLNFRNDKMGIIVKQGERCEYVTGNNSCIINGICSQTPICSGLTDKTIKCNYFDEYNTRKCTRYAHEESQSDTATQLNELSELNKKQLGIGAATLVISTLGFMKLFRKLSDN